MTKASAQDADAENTCLMHDHQEQTKMSWQLHVALSLQRGVTSMLKVGMTCSLIGL